ncbi:uncharacterized protein H6S33_008796 [Morchella sextelata]|uniref:uncharacterized protein n=1 Tax=Morchella sextelata TaxID=1174677 RepID=UPI001D043C24|nr:uncharacterized protein H6S33_008796 [Morchella sextelata]KAH0602457.1 hypothetical protein H6S33_008796 [Morchella sextelata]
MPGSPNKRLHHCPGCSKTINLTVCERKGHVVRCPFHPTKYLKPGTECPKCKVIRETAERKERQQRIDEANGVTVEVKKAKLAARKYGKW